MDDIRTMMAKSKGKSEIAATKAGMAKKAKGMVDLKVTKAESKKRNSPMVSSSYEGEKYPYGLTLNLDEDTLTKLGISLPEVGEEVELCAKAMVTEASARETTSGGKRRSCALQIQKLQVK